MKGACTFKDFIADFFCFVDVVEGKITGLSEKLDQQLAQDTRTFNLENLSNEVTSTTGRKKSVNHVKEAIDQLEELYEKTGETEKLLKLQDVKNKATTEGLTVKEINDLAKLHGIERSGFSESTGKPLTSINKRSYENTRKGLKTKARELFGDESFVETDKAISDLISTNRNLTKVAEKVNSLNQRVDKRGLGQRVGRAVFNLIDTLTGGFTTGVVRSALVPRGRGFKTLNSLDLEKQLSKNLKKLDGLVDDISKAKTDKEALNIINKFEKQLTTGSGLFGGLFSD